MNPQIESPPTRTLADWLKFQEELHPNAIDLGLDRVREVLRRLDFRPPSCSVITIAGTKGKGSTAAILNSIYASAGYRTGVFTSPHLLRYNERIRIHQQEISDESLCVVFERIDAARGDISLTYFEFNTLAALLAFSTANLDVWILEVGMGGRLDATNVIDANLSLVTSIGIDHTEWLGNDVESIGREKAGIFRSGRMALFGSVDMPNSIQQVANEMQSPLLRAGQQFGFETKQNEWSWWMRCDNQAYSLESLPRPGISGDIQLQNAALSLAAIYLLNKRLPLSRKAIEQGLREVRLSGRFDRLITARTPGVEWILDVAHNPMSAAVLAAHLHAYIVPKDTVSKGAVSKGKVIAIFGMLSDKDVMGTIRALSAEVDEWIAVTLGGTRTLSKERLSESLRECGVNIAGVVDSVVAGCELARQCVVPGDRVLVCGSFMTVAPALQWLNSTQ